MAGTFEIFKDNGGEFRFRLKSGNGQVVLSSEGYSAKNGAVGGAESVRKNCEDGSCFESGTTPGGQFRFNMKAKNNQVIGTSQTYDSEAARDQGVQAIATAAKDSTIVDLTA